MNDGGNGAMQIQQIQLSNFRGVKNLAIDFGCKSAVLLGVNGTGKSTILHSINLLFSNIINRIVSNKFKQGAYLDYSDIMFGASNADIRGDFCFDDGEIINYSRGINKSNHRKTHNLSNLNNFCNRFSELYLGDDAIYTMPIFANYGVNRSVLDVPLRIRTAHEFSRETAFQNSIQSKIDFRTFFEWFRNQEDYENQVKVETKDLKYVDISLLAVKKAILAMLPDLSNLQVKRNPLRMCATKDGVQLRVEQLSDGEKCTLAMFGDLARRLSIANPGAADPLLGGGIVLIDEIELHMHPSWQRRVISCLHDTFPNIQFIISTHSPQVLGEIGDKINVFSLETIDGQVHANLVKPFGFDSNLVLEELMGTPSVTKKVSVLVSEMYACIDNKDYNSATSKADKIDMLTSNTNADTVRARIMIARGKRHEAN